MLTWRDRDPFVLGRRIRIRFCRAGSQVAKKGRSQAPTSLSQAVLVFGPLPGRGSSVFSTPVNMPSLFPMWRSRGQFLCGS